LAGGERREKRGGERDRERERGGGGGWTGVLGIQVTAGALFQRISFPITLSHKIHGVVPPGTVECGSRWSWLSLPPGIHQLIDVGPHSRPRLEIVATGAAKLATHPVPALGVSGVCFAERCTGRALLTT
jgi:hypothetical protein